MKLKLIETDRYFFLLDEDETLPPHHIHIEKFYWENSKPGSPKVEIVGHWPKLESEPIDGLPLLPPIDMEKIPTAFEPEISVVHCDKCPGGFEEYIQVTINEDTNKIYLIGRYL